jgi:hypothetical protein
LANPSLSLKFGLSTMLDRRLAEQAVRAARGVVCLHTKREFYAQSADELFGMRARKIEFQPEPGWSASNPSICQGQDRLRCVVRTVNYKIVGGTYVTPSHDVVSDGGRWHGWQIIRTRNFLIDLDDVFKTTRSVEMVDVTGEARTSYSVHGFEDARLFYWKEKWWATATVCDFTEDGQREIALCEISAEGAIVRADALRGPWSDQVQKNWMPLVDGHKAKLIYATSPTLVFDLIEHRDRGHTVEFPVGATLGYGRLRGGSQAVRTPDGSSWICIVHDVAFPGGARRIYLHRFIQFDADLRLVAMSDPFYFEQLGIEFCAGLALVGNQFVASYAVNDGSACLGIFDWDSIRTALRTNFVV